MNSHTQSIKNSWNWQKIVPITIGLLIAALLATFTFNSVKKLVISWEITTLPGLAIKAPTPTPQPGEELPIAEEENNPVPAEPSIELTGPVPDPWDGASRVTVLVMGLDYSDWRAGEGPPRTDTMILLTLDPISKTAGMLSIPRDLWVSIPGFDYGKINTAYQLGEAFKFPGGGPGLALKTVENLIGVPIQYYSQIDFSVFVQFIDEIYGIKVDVPYEIFVDIYDDALGKKRIEPGVQVLPGEYALAYARARNTEGADFDRAQRQQQVIMGIRDRLLEPRMITDLISKAPDLYSKFSSGINTNFSLEEIIQLAWLAKGIPTESIYHGIIGEKQVNFGKSPDGLDVLKPLPDEIRLLRNDIFIPAGAFTPAMDPNADPLSLLIEENASIYILNGTFTAGIAGLTMEYMQSLGANIIGTNDASDKPYPYTQIFDHTGNPYTIQYLVELMQISKFRIFNSPSPKSHADVTIIVGNDWVNVNPMP